MRTDLAQKRHAAFAIDPTRVLALKPTHPAIQEKRAIFPTRVFSPDEVPRILISGHNSRKTGRKVTKGPWAGLPIFTLTLEERATCPASCFMFRSCYGNGMPYARRVKHGPRFECELIKEVVWLGQKNPRGLVIRLHVLGDFYSPFYVSIWAELLDLLPALRIYGYTSRNQAGSAEDAAIALAIAGVNDCFPERCAIRFSSPLPGPMGATVIDRMPASARVEEGIVCPAELDKTSCCGDCGLCWSPTMRDETIVFIKHGNPLSGRPPGRRLA